MWRYQPEGVVRAAYGRGRAIVHVAGLLLAGAMLPAAAAPADDVHIFALGDSLTAGYGLPRRQGFVPQLEAYLRRQGIRARITNAGVSGDTAAQGRQRLAWTIEGLKQPRGSPSSHSAPTTCCAACRRSRRGRSWTRSWVN
jgi:acyl-CoA thioesterase-1